MTIKEVACDEAITRLLIALSEDWEQENSCYGYRKNTPEDLRGNRIFLASDENAVCGYLFGHIGTADKAASIYPAGTVYFEVEELYVKPEFRDQGIGKQLFQYVEHAVAGDAEILLLTTATKNYSAILHFYIEELGMDFWSARLFKRIR